MPGGFIVRTAAEGRGEDEFVQDIRFLGNLWSDIRSKSDKKSAPALIHRDLNLVQRMLRDQLSQDFARFASTTKQEFATVLDFVNKFQPALVNRVKLHLKDTPIFEEYGLNTEIDKALRPKVWLKSGGYIVINQTEALVAIDVNTGKYVGKVESARRHDRAHQRRRRSRNRPADPTAESGRHHRRRFHRHGGEEESAARDGGARRSDARGSRSPSKILQFNDFGLVAITRKRTQPSLERTICAAVLALQRIRLGRSRRKRSATTFSRRSRKMAHLLEGKGNHHARESRSRKGAEERRIRFHSNELEEWTKKDIVVKSDPLLHEEHFDIF